MRLLQPPEVDRIEHVAVQNQLLGLHRPAAHFRQEVDEVLRLAVVAAEVDVGDDDGIVHGSLLAGRYLLHNGARGGLGVESVKVACWRSVLAQENGMIRIF